MDNLDKLLELIQSETSEQIDVLKADDERYRERLFQEAEAQRQSILAEAVKRAEKDAEQLIARASSMARADRRKADLAAKQSDVARLIELALKQLVTKPKDDRITLYAGIIRNGAIAPGELILGKNDQDIADALLSKLPDGFTTSKEVGDFQGGFVVRRGAIEENFTYDLIVRNHRPELAQLAMSLIKDEQG